ncbi:hypothetical protein BJ165DRAFT_1524142 [Panaeolus papilionaceus]|nr:hypothetical protein BJ165DRAFT_1524142 [Panaeolus papilionaceus]
MPYKSKNQIYFVPIHHIDNQSQPQRYNPPHLNLTTTTMRYITLLLLTFLSILAPAFAAVGYVSWVHRRDTGGGKFIYSVTITEEPGRQQWFVKAQEAEWLYDEGIKSGEWVSFTKMTGANSQSAKDVERF